MTDADAGALLDDLARQAERVFRADGYHATIALIFARSETKATTVPLRDERDRAMLRAWFEAEARAGVQAIALISEAWLAARVRPEDVAEVLAYKAQHGSLETLPGRIEALTIDVATPRHHRSALYQIHREGGRAVLAPRPVPRSHVLLGRFFTDLPWRDE